MTRARRVTLARRAGAVLAFAVVAVSLNAVLREFSVADFDAAVRRQAPLHLAASLALTAVSFACLALCDLVGVRVTAPGRLRASLALLAGGAAGAVANTLGFPAISGSAVRAHLYVPAALTGAETARVVSLSWLSMVAGNATTLAVALLWQAATVSDRSWHVALGLGLVGLLLCGFAWLTRAPREIALWRLRLPTPTPSLALLLTALGALESCAAIGALYVLLPRDLDLPLGTFAVDCIAAVILGVVSHAPGGLGVFEASMMAILSGRGRPDLLAALLLFRLLYNILPFLLAVALLGTRYVWMSCRPGVMPKQAR